MRKIVIALDEYNWTVFVQPMEQLGIQKEVEVKEVFVLVQVQVTDGLLGPRRFVQSRFDVVTDSQMKHIITIISSVHINEILMVK